MSRRDHVVCEGGGVERPAVEKMGLSYEGGAQATSP